MLNRSTVLRGLAVTGMAAAARPASAQGLPTLRIGTFASESTAGAFYAQEQGFFAKRGLTVTISTASGGAAVGSAMVAGDLDIGEADCVTIATAHDKGLPFVFIAPGELHSNRYPTFACVVKDPAVKLGKDFNDKTMACNVSRGFGSLLTNAWIDNNGGDSKTVKWVEFPFPALAAALQRGTIDGYCAPEPFISQALSQGATLVLMDRNFIATTILQGGWFATKEWVAKNPAVVKLFAEAIIEADDWANKNEKATAEVLSKVTRIPLTVIEGMKMRGQYATRFDPATLQPLIDVAAKYGYISKVFPARDLIVTL
jgi:NitT/TauT family transport system substrate-binding protein